MKARRHAAWGLLVGFGSLVSVVVSAAAATHVEVGISGAVSDVGFFIAQDKGYFGKEGLDVNFTNFDSATKMIAPLGAGQLDVGGGSPAAGLYNAIARSIDIKIVADKGSTPAGHGFQPLMVRKDLIDSGKFKSLADLKGLKVAISGAGSGSSATLSEAARKGGLKVSDIDVVYLAFPQQVPALQNKAIDAAFTTEPNASEEEQRGIAVRFMGDDQIYPNHQLAVVLYSAAFAKKTDAAQAFMRAYIRGLRDYLDALNPQGKLDGPQAADVVAILTKNSEIKNGDIFRKIVVNGADPDGKVNVDSLKRDLEIFKASGDVKGSITVDQALDESFQKAAVQALGPYQPKSTQ